MANTIKIDTSALGINWALDTEYRVAIEEAAIFQSSGLKLPVSANANVTTFRTSATLPAISSTYPSNGTVADKGIENISFTINRPAVTALTGNVDLYRVSSPNVLVKSSNIANLTITGNTVSMNIVGNLTPNANYYVRTSANIVADPDNFKFPGITSNSSFTFTAPGVPTLSSTYPPSGNTSVVENTTISMILDRDAVAGTGNIYLYKVGSPNTLIKTYTVGSNVSFSGNSINLNINGILSNVSSYYVTTDANVAKDRTGFNWAGISSGNTSAFAFTTSSDFSNDLPWQPLADIYYNEDTNTKIIAPTVLPVAAYDTQSYTLTITSTNGIYNMYSGGTGGSFTWTYNNPGGNLVITGTRTQINSYLNDLYFTPIADFANNFSISYSLVNPQSVVTTKTQNFYIDQQNTETLNLANTRTYLSNTTSSLLFPSNPIQIDDAGATGQTYSVTLSSASVYIFFENNQNSITYTGSKTDVNNSLANVTIRPNLGYTGNTTITYTQIRNGQSQNSGTFALNNAGDGFTEQQVYTFSNNNTWTPSANQIQFGRMTVEIVGAGGGGARSAIAEVGGGGGGGGGVYLKLDNRPIENKTYNITVGAGSFGAAGGSSSFDGFTASGGGAGLGAVTITPTGYGVSNINYNRAGGGSVFPGGTWSANVASTVSPPKPWEAGGGGGGAGGAGGSPTYNSGLNRYNGGGAGAGVTGIGGTVYGRGGSGATQGLYSVFNGADGTGQGGSGASGGSGGLYPGGVWVNSRGGSGIVKIHVTSTPGYGD